MIRIRRIRRQRRYLDVISKKYYDSSNIFPKPMTDKEFRRLMTNYFLGENWYQPNPVSPAQCNVYIATEIITKYLSMEKKDE